MKKPGTIVRWDPLTDTGHIRSPDTPAEVLFHRQDCRGLHPIAAGTAVVFEEIVIGGQGPRALNVQAPPLAPPAPLPELDTAEPPLPAALRPSAAPSAAQRWREQRDQQRLARWALGLFGAWVLLCLLGIGLGRLPWVLLPGLALLNIATFFLYWRDHRVAHEGGSPWPAEHLHLAAALGGWPAAWLAQQSLQHRQHERRFQRAFVLCAAFNAVALLVWIAWPLWAPGRWTGA